MSKGSLRCCGSPLYLKSKYSSGYNLVLTKLKKTDELTNMASMSDDLETDNRAVNLVKSVIAEAKVNENLASEISFILPAEQTPKFGELFEKLETQKEKLNVNNIGISISTLEDVFLKYITSFYPRSPHSLIYSLLNKRINENEEEPVRTSSSSPRGENGNYTNAGFETSNRELNKTTPLPTVITPDSKEFGLWIGSDQRQHLVDPVRLVFQQFVALLLKRWVHTLRNKVLTITQIMIPIGVMIIQLVYLKYAPLKPTDMPSLDIDLGQYAQNYAPYQISAPNGFGNLPFLTQLADAYESRFKSFVNSEAFNLDQKVTTNKKTYKS